MKPQRELIKNFHKVARAAGADFHALRERVKNGEAEFFKLGRCHFVTCEEVSASGRELVVLCAEGKGVKQSASVLYDLARKGRFDSIRFHTKHKGISRLISHLPFKPVETVYKLEF